VGKRAVIDRDRRAFRHCNNRQLVCRQAMCGANALGNALNGGNQLVAHRLIVGTHRYLQVRIF
jgi:hypothetical protein